MEWIQERGWYTLNGATAGDWDGEYTYVGVRGSTVIDYIIVNEKGLEKVIEFRIGDRVDLDHMPVELKGEERRRQ